MADPEHVEILRQGAEVWNEWKAANPDIKPDLSKIFIYGEILPKELNVLNIVAEKDGIKIPFSWTGADFKGTNFTGSKCHFLNFSRSDFSDAFLSGTFLNVCAFDNSNLTKVVLYFARINYCMFSNAIFSGCKCAFNSFESLDLSLVKGLEKTVHFGPSSIDIDSIYKSNGKIPKAFLRGCGVPEDFIKLIPSLTAQPFEFYKCFISHSTLDMDFCKRLHADLQNEGVRVWFFPEDARTGRGVWDEIDKSIKIYDKLMVVCSENSLKSGPVLREINRALQREDQEGKRILFPIAIDNYIFDEWEHPRKADVLDTVVFRKFMDWKNHDSYQKAFDRLMRDLKASEEEVE